MITEPWKVPVRDSRAHTVFLLILTFKGKVFERASQAGKSTNGYRLVPQSRFRLLGPHNSPWETGCTEGSWGLSVGEGEEHLLP